MPSSDRDEHRAYRSNSVAPGGRLLEGCHVLVVENDYFQRDGMSLCLTDAGAIVIGPTDNAADALRLVANGGVNAAILDINLGDGASFELALHLRRSKVPMLFVTGHECSDIPPELSDADCLQKPVAEHVQLEAAARAWNGGMAA